MGRIALLIGVCLSVVVLSGCVGQDDDALSVLEEPEWEPFTRLKMIGEISWEFNFCLNLDGCVEVDGRAERIVCDPPQLELVRYEVARDTGSWPDPRNVATAELLASFQNEQIGSSDYLTCSFDYEFYGEGSSLLPGTFTLRIDPGASETCSFGPNSGCKVRGVVPHEVVFQGPGEKGDLEMELTAFMQWIGMQRSLSEGSRHIDMFIRT